MWPVLQTSGKSKHTSPKAARTWIESTNSDIRTCFEYSPCLCGMSGCTRQTWLACNRKRLLTSNVARKRGAECCANRPTAPHASSNTQLSKRFAANSIIHSFSEPLLATQVFLCRLCRDVATEELNRLRFTFQIVTKPGARPPQIIRGQLIDPEPSRIPLVPYPQ